MVQLILIRPGSTDYDSQGRIQGTLNVPLNANGSSEVAHLIDELRDKHINRVYTSDGESATETAQALSTALGVKLKTLDKLQNLNHGLWQGMCKGEVKRKHPKLYRQWQEKPENVRPPEGETLSEARRRIGNVVKKLIKKHKAGATIALVVPEPLATVIRCYLQDCAVGDLWKASDEHGCWELIEVAPEAAAT